MKPPASVEDLAFKKMPEVGPAPDMIFDDLPTNLDYLDESFGAAAGLRELVDEDLDQFSDDEIDIQTTPLMTVNMTETAGIQRPFADLSIPDSSSNASTSSLRFSISSFLLRANSHKPPHAFSGTATTCSATTRSNVVW